MAALDYGNGRQVGGGRFTAFLQRMLQCDEALRARYCAKQSQKLGIEDKGIDAFRIQILFNMCFPNCIDQKFLAGHLLVFAAFIQEIEWLDFLDG